MNPTEFMLDIVLRDDEPEEEAEIRNLAGSLPATKPPQNSTVGAFTDACNVIDIPEFSEIAATTNNKGSKGARIEPEDRQRLSVIIPRRKPDFSLLYLQSVTFKSILEGIYQSTRIPELRSLCPASQEHVEELYDSSSLAPNDNTCNINFSSASYSSSFLEINTLIHRTWKDTRRNPSIAYIRTIAALLIAVLVGIIFFQLPNNNTSSGNRINSLLFLMCVFSLFCLPAISKLIEDRLLFYRERDAGVYSTWSYFVAEAVVELPILFSIAWVYGTVSYWMVGLQPTAANFFFFLAIISLVINVGFSLSQAIAAGVRTTNMAIAVYMIVLVYSLLLGGFMISKDNLPSGMQWLINTSYFFYGFESLVINEFELKNYGDDNLKVLEFQGDGKFTDLGALCVFFLGFRLIAYLLLRFKRIEKII